MNAGDLNERLIIQRINYNPDCVYWRVQDRIWGRAEHKIRRNLFSNVGIGAQTIEFTIRNTDISLHDSIGWGDKHCFITDISKIGRLYLKLTAAISVVLCCRVERSAKGYNELGNPIDISQGDYTFPACITEKYVGYTQNEPQSVTDTSYVFVTPKCVSLKAGTVIYTLQGEYAIKKCHMADPYKNEYEALWKEEN